MILPILVADSGCIRRIIITNQTYERKTRSYDLAVYICFVVLSISTIARCLAVR